MKANAVIAPELQGRLSSAPTIGVDIGSRQAKAVLLSDSDGEVHTATTASGVDAQETADRVVRKVLRQAGIELKDIAYVIGTGYGRISIAYDEVPTGIVTEISCHAMGAHFLNAATKTIIDIGGQDSKAIRIDPESGKETKRVVLRFHPQIAPVQAAVFPLARNKADLVERAQTLERALRPRFRTRYDEGNVGQLYRRQDEIGTPWCITIDHESAASATVTVRDRYSLAQERLAIDGLAAELAARLAAPWTSPKAAS